MIENKLYTIKATTETDSSDNIITRYILLNWKNIINKKGSDIQKEIGVSKSTLNRFCKTLGFKTFTEFKYQLFFELSKQKQYEGNSCQEYDQEILSLFQSKKRIIVLGEGDEIASLIAYQSVFEKKGVELLLKIKVDSPLKLLSQYEVSSKDLVVYVSLKKNNMQLQIESSSFYVETMLWLIEHKIPFVYIGLMAYRREFEKYFIEIKKQQSIRDEYFYLCDIFEKIHNII